MAAALPTLLAGLQEEATQKLVNQAIKAQENAYCPYSKYHVGAALLSDKGGIFEGCNVENAAYGDTICAERGAACHAIAKGHKVFVAVVVITKDGKGMPCGSCRQVLNEFNPKMVVLTADPKGTIIHRTTVEQLLPKAFGPQNL